MNTTASWPLFAATTPVDNRIDLIGQQNNFNKMMSQSNNTPNNNEFNQKPDDLSSHLSKHQKQIHDSFNHLKINNNIKNNNNNNNNDSNTGNSEILNLRIDGSRDEDLDDEDNDSMIDSIGDDDSLPSPDAMYATSYLSSDSIDRNGIKEEMGSEGQSVGDQSPINPLAQLQNAFGKHSDMLGMNLTDFSPSNGNNPSVFGFGSPAIGNPFNPDGDITGESYRCHLCSYTGISKCQFNAHMNTHFDHKCPFCDYTSRTEGRLKRHIRDFHSEVPPESWAGNRVLRENADKDGEESMDPTDTTVNGSGGKSRKYKCKQCEFVATCKQEFWDHSKDHIKTEKLLTCPKCNFVTEYKHHLEYHLRNHFGSKPFKCAKCNYSCVNKSMLNSHMKSHSNIYQYRCADCSYATKYCHSLKLHLRKYQHKPATVLNLDGTPNPYPVIDVYGTRRGPRPKKAKDIKNSHNSQKSPQNESSLPQTQLMASPLSPNMLNTTPIPPLIPTSIPMGLPFMYPPNPALLHSGLLGPQGMPQIPHLPNQMNAIPHSLYDSPLIGDKSSNSSDSCGKPSNQSPHSTLKMKCNFCDFTADSRELFGRHLLLHVSAENQDICKMYGMSPTPEALHQNAIISELAARQTNESRRLLEQIAVNPSFINTLLGMPKPEQLMDWHSNRDSIESQTNSTQMSAKSDDQMSRPESAPVRPNSKSAVSPLPRSRSSPNDRFESFERENPSTNAKSSNSSETTPLDLSSNKSISPITQPLTQPLEAKFAILSQQLSRTTDSPLLSQIFRQRDEEKQKDEENKSRRSPIAAQPETQQIEQQSRAQRRKGRASKLVVNRMDDESLKNDELDEDISEETADSIHEEPDVDNIITKINNATSLLQEILIDMYSLKNDSYH